MLTVNAAGVEVIVGVTVFVRFGNTKVAVNAWVAVGIVHCETLPST